MMKVLMFGPLPSGSFGGVATVIADICKCLSRIPNLSLRVYNDSVNADDYSNCKANRADYVVYPRTPSIYSYLKSFGIYRTLTTVVLHNFYKLIGYYPNRGIKQYRYTADFLHIEKIIDDYQPDIIHAHHAHYRPIVSWLASRGRIPIITTIHSFSNFFVSHRLQRQKLQYIYNKTFELSSALIAVSELVRLQAIQLGAPPLCLTVIPNGVDSEVFSPFSTQNLAQPTLKRDNACKVVLYSGALTRLKGLNILIQAFAIVARKMSNLKLIIIGDGPEKYRLETLSHKLAPGKVEFIGAIRHSELPSYYQNSDVFVLPSRSEGLSVSLLEAMASCVPVITTRPQSSEHDVIVQGKTGFLTEFGDVPRIAQTIETLLCNNHLTSQIVANARELVLQKYEIDRIAKLTYLLYCKVLS